jgi:hypothetical protein
MTNLNTGMYSLKVKGTTEQNNSTVITKQNYVDEDLTWTAFVKELCKYLYFLFSEEHSEANCSLLLCLLVTK